MKYKIRFHLAHGENFQKWQVKKDKEVVYYDPDQFTLVMKNCKLKNHRTVAVQIHEGSHKTVCAWIECDELEIIPAQEFDGTQICYNPKIAPHWRQNSEDIDNRVYKLLRTSKRKVLVDS